MASPERHVAVGRGVSMNAVGGLLPAVIGNGLENPCAGVVVRDAEAHVVGAGRGVRERRILSRRVVELAVTVEIPGVTDDRAVGIARARAEKFTVSGVGPVVGAPETTATGGWLPAVYVMRLIVPVPMSA